MIEVFSNDKALTMRGAYSQAKFFLSLGELRIQIKLFQMRFLEIKKLPQMAQLIDFLGGFITPKEIFNNQTVTLFMGS